jgi:hypothetical protein
LQFESKQQGGQYVLQQGKKHPSYLKEAKKISGCHAKALAIISGNGESIQVSPICNNKGQTWQSFALIGKLAISKTNINYSQCNKQHLNESEIGLQLAKEGEVVQSSSSGGW